MIRIICLTEVGLQLARRLQHLLKVEQSTPEMNFKAWSYGHIPDNNIETQLTNYFNRSLFGMHTQLKFIDTFKTKPVEYSLNSEVHFFVFHFMNHVFDFAPLWYFKITPAFIRS